MPTTINRSGHDNTSAHRALVARQERQIATALDKQKRHRDDLDKRHAAERTKTSRYDQTADEVRRRDEAKRLAADHANELRLMRSNHQHQREAAALRAK
jgi:hypothetical protein